MISQSQSSRCRTELDTTIMKEMVMPSKLTINVYSSWIITKSGFSKQTSKGVVVSTDGVTMEGQFIQTLTAFNVGVLPKKV